MTTLYLVGVSKNLEFSQKFGRVVLAGVVPVVGSIAVLGLVLRDRGTRNTLLSSRSDTQQG